METITNKRAFEVEQKEDGTWIGYTYHKVRRSWVCSGATFPYDSRDKARKAAIDLSSRIKVMA